MDEIRDILKDYTSNDTAGIVMDYLKDKCFFCENNFLTEQLKKCVYNYDEIYSCFYCLEKYKLVDCMLCKNYTPMSNVNMVLDSSICLPCIFSVENVDAVLWLAEHNSD